MLVAGCLAMLTALLSMCSRQVVPDSDTSETKETKVDLVMSAQMAIRRNRPDILEFCLDSNLDIDFVFSNGRTLLQEAVFAKNRAITEYLLAYGADPNKNTPLVDAVELMDPIIAEILLQKGAAINMGTEAGVTAFQMAAINNDENIMEMLLRRGANSLLDNINNQNALMQAAYHGSLEAVEFLLEVCPEIDINAVDNTGATALMFAAFARNVEIAKLLLENDANPNRMTFEKKTALHFLLRDLDSDFTDGEDNPEIFQRRQEIFKLLVAHGADLRIKDITGKSPMFLVNGKGSKAYSTVVKEHRRK